MIPPRPTTVHNAVSPAVHPDVFTPFTTGMNTFANMITPRVMLIIPVTSGFAMIFVTPTSHKGKKGFIYSAFINDII